MQKKIYDVYNLLLRTFYRSLQQFLKTKIPISQKLNFFLSSISAFFKMKKSLGKPVLLTIEPTNTCDQKCPICETGNGTLGREKRVMSYDSFKNIINQFDGTLNQLYFYFMGEPFLNKDAYKMIEYAENRGIYVSTCTNGNFVDPGNLINSKISEVNFQISGMTQKLHTRYRVGGKLKQVLSKIEETVKIRDKHKAKTKIFVGYILMKHNEHQLNDFITFCKKAQVDNYNIIGTTARTVKQAKEFMPSNSKYRIFSEKKLEKGLLVPKQRPNNYCGYLYGGTNIMVNGDVVSCCRDPKGKNVLGNVFDNNIYKIWNNEKYQRVRTLVNKKSNSLDLCKICIGENVPELKEHKK